MLVYLFTMVPLGEVNAQAVWTWLSPQPQGNVLAAVQAFDTNIVVAVGNLSTIIRTTDGGSHWDVRYRVGGTAYDLTDMAFDAGGRGIAVGLYGKVLVTTDAGESWSAHSAGTSSHLSAIEHVGDQTWIAISFSTFYRSTNGGLAWANIVPAGTYSLNDLYFITPSIGFAVGTPGSVLRTSDGGLTWEDRSVNTTYALRGAHFFTPDTGFVWGDLGVYFQTTDGGQTWSSRSSVPTLGEVTFVSRQTGYASGSPTSDEFYKTTDGGENWLWAGSGRIGALSFVNANVGFGVGREILKTADAGNSWQSLSGPIECDFFSDITFADEATGVAVGWGSTIYRTTNSGADWDSRWGGSYGWLRGVILTDSLGLAVGNAGEILRSTNKGQDWTSLNSGTTIDLHGVGLHDSVAIAVGDSGYILRSSDRGLTWARISSGTEWTLRSVGFFTSDTVIVMGGEPYVSQGGIILRSTDNGVSWTAVLSVLQNVFNRVAVNGRTAIAASQHGIVYVSTDCGASWVGRWLGIEDDLYGIALSTDQIGITAASSGRVFSTSNGGATWVDANSPSENWLQSVCYVNPDTVIAVGWNSTILRFEPSGATGIDPMPDLDELVPNGLVLHQNFPNPFNPTTTIRYQLLSAMQVELVVFDLLGKEVRVLVNERQSRGAHSVLFDGSDLPSGVYFYRLSAGAFVNMKKLVLLK